MHRPLYKHKNIYTGKLFSFRWQNFLFGLLNIFLQALLSQNVKKHTHFSLRYAVRKCPTVNFVHFLASFVIQKCEETYPFFLRYTVHKCPTVNPQISLILLSSKRNVDEVKSF